MLLNYALLVNPEHDKRISFGIHDFIIALGPSFANIISPQLYFRNIRIGNEQGINEFEYHKRS